MLLGPLPWLRQQVFLSEDHNVYTLPLFLRNRTNISSMPPCWEKHKWTFVWETMMGPEVEFTL